MLSESEISSKIDLWSLEDGSLIMPQSLDILMFTDLFLVQETDTLSEVKVPMATKEVLFRDMPTGTLTTIKHL